MVHYYSSVEVYYNGLHDVTNRACVCVCLVNAMTIWLKDDILIKEVV